MANDDDDDDEDIDDCISVRLSTRCFLVPALSFANGIASIESMLEFDCEKKNCWHC